MNVRVVCAVDARVVSVSFNPLCFFTLRLWNLLNNWKSDKYNIVLYSYNFVLIIVTNVLIFTKHQVSNILKLGMHFVTATN